MRKSIKRKSIINKLISFALVTIMVLMLIMLDTGAVMPDPAYEGIRNSQFGIARPRVSSPIN